MSGSAEVDRLERLFHDALELDADERAAFVESTALEEPELAAALSELLAAEEAPDDRLTGSSTARGGLWSELTGSLDYRKGDLVGPFRIEEKLGEGGMATVYRAVRETEAFRQEVAVKVLRPGLVTEDGLARFDRERRIVAALDHPNIARLIDGGVTPDGRPYFALELVEGRPLDVYCDEERLSVTDRIDLVVAVGEALHYAHRNLVVHRDLKPSNVVVGADGRVRLLDFGIAKELDLDVRAELTRSGSLPMTPIYSTPEQLSGRPVTTASDQYQLGLLLFEILTGQCHHLMDGTDSASIQRRATDLESPRPSRLVEGRTTAAATSPDADWRGVAERRRVSVSELAREIRGDLDTIILKALEKDPEWRYPSVAAMVEDLRRFLRGRPIEAQAPSTLYRARKWVQRHRALTAMAATLAVFVLAAVAWGLRQDRRARLAGEFAQRVERQTERFEQILATAALQPLHDTTRERGEVREGMERLEREGAEQPDLLGPAADYGVGRGYLALGEPEDAAERLRRAWDAGFRGAGIRFALGSALGELYQGALESAEAIEDPATSRQRIDRAVRELRDPALEHLRAAAPELGTGPRLREALISFWEGDLEGALERARRVRAEFPRHTGAMALEARIVTRRAEQAIHAGSAAPARVDLDEAGALVAQALAIARSDAALYLLECERLYAEVLLGGAAGARLDGLVAAAERACGNASRIRPDWVAPHLQLGSTYLTAWDLERWHRPAHEIRSRVRRSAERALALDPDNGEAHHRLGVALHEEGWQDSIRGVDPGPSYRAALESLSRAATLDPEYPYTYNALALVHNSLARWEIENGRPGVAGEQLSLGLPSAHRAVALLPEWPNARSNLAAHHAIECERAALMGEDPVTACTAALAELDTSLAASPDLTRIRLLRLRVLWQLSGYLADQGRWVPELAAQLADAAAGSGDPGAFGSWAASAASGAAMQAAWRAIESGATRPSLAPVRERLLASLELVPDHGNSAMMLLHLELFELRRDVDEGRSTRTAVQRVQAATQRLESLEQTYPQKDRLLAERGRVLAALAMMRGRNPAPYLEEGSIAVERSLDRNPLQWGAVAERAALALLSAVSGTDASRDLGRARRDLDDLRVRTEAWESRLAPLRDVLATLESGSPSSAQAARRLLEWRGAFPGR